jgi:Lecithin retinol acyltransferase
MAKGDHLFYATRFSGIPYQHHGVDMGDGSVIHLAPVSGACLAFHDPSDRFCVRRDSRDDFAGGQDVKTVHHEAPLDPEQIAERAESFLGRSGYNLLDNNCEHFANYCCTGVAESRQVDMGQHAVVSTASMATKVFWTVAASLGKRLAGATTVRTAIRSNPLLLLADGVELAAITVGCASGLSPKKTQRIARISGNIVAAGIGGIVAGPAGAAASLAVHRSSTAIAEHACHQIRRISALMYVKPTQE